MSQDQLGKYSRPSLQLGKYALTKIQWPWLQNSCFDVLNTY